MKSGLLKSPSLNDAWAAIRQRSVSSLHLNCWLDRQRFISVILFDSVWQERPEFSEVVAKLEECLSNVEVSQVHIIKRSFILHSCFYICCFSVFSWCPPPPATAVVLCLPLLQRTAWRHEEVPDGVTWPRFARVLSWNTPWMLGPMHFGARSTNISTFYFLYPYFINMNILQCHIVGAWTFCL